MPASRKPDNIYAFRPFVSWLLLAAAAGAVNVLAFFATERFVSHVTGTAARVGIAGASLWLAVDFMVVLVCFILGATAAAFVIDVRGGRGRTPLHAVPLIGTSALLVAVALLGIAGVFGPFGGAPDDLGDLALVSTLSFAMGLENGAVATNTGMVVRTTHLTGSATDLGVGLAHLALPDAGARQKAIRMIGLRGGKILAFIAGAALAVPLAHRLEYASFLVPAAVVVVANVLGFVAGPGDRAALGRGTPRIPNPTH